MSIPCAAGARQQAHPRHSWDPPGGAGFVRPYGPFLPRQGRWTERQEAYFGIICVSHPMEIATLATLSPCTASQETGQSTMRVGVPSSGATS